jgi:hypothetical protein
VPAVPRPLGRSRRLLVLKGSELGLEGGDLALLLGQSSSLRLDSVG